MTFKEHYLNKLSNQVVYHVSPSDISPMEIKPWSHFSTSKEQAINIIETHRVEQRVGKQYFLYTYHLKDGSYIRTDDKDDTDYWQKPWDFYVIKTALEQNKHVTTNVDFLHWCNENNIKKPSLDDAKNWVEHEYDGVCYLNVKEEPSAMTYIVFHPAKSLIEISKELI
jgi:hypothetical protein